MINKYKRMKRIIQSNLYYCKHTVKKVTLSKQIKKKVINLKINNKMS